MKRKVRKQWLVMVGLACMSTMGAHAKGRNPAADDGVRHENFGGRVTIATDGKATIDAVTGINGALEQAVRSQLAALRFVPARRGGIAVPGTVPLSGNVTLTPAENDDYDVRIGAVALRPHLENAPPPRYPIDRIRAQQSGAVVLRLQVGADGQIRDARTLSSSHRKFEEAVRDAMKGWRFEPLPEGMAAMDVDVPVWFHIVGGRPASKPAFQCASDPDMAHVEGQDACADLIEVALYRVARAG